MKKITLTAIIVFTLVIVITFIGSNFSYTKQTLPVENLNLINTLNNNQVKKIKPSVKVIKKISNKIKKTSSTKPLNKHINPPNININNLVFTLEQSSKDSFTINGVSKHNTKNDCYLIINNKVYDVSSYISYHPGGSRTITYRCGKEVTGIFAKIHSNWAWDLLKKYKIGNITTNKQDTTFQILVAISDALKKTNPTAEIVKVRPKTNFYVAKIINKGKLYEIHINNNGQIIQEEIENEEFNWSLWDNDNDDK